MKIDCKECGVRILAEDIDLPSSTAKCRSCNAVFSFAHRQEPAFAPVAQRERLRAPRPDGLEVTQTSVPAK